MKEYFKKIYKDTANDFYKLIKQKLINNEKTFVVTANPETLMISEKNEQFKKVLIDDKTIIIPDGIGIVKGAKILKCDIKEVIPGVELSEKLFEFCNEFKKSIFLFGAKEEILKMLVKRINEKYSNITILGCENGYVKNKQEVFQRISDLNPDVILVALGIPNQELLIYNNLNKFDKGIFVGVGGSFDVLSGSKKRAPKIFRKLHIEWLYRILREPQRLKRFLNSNIKYILKIVKIKIKKNSKGDFE